MNLELRTKVARAIGWQFRNSADDPTEQWFDPEGNPRLFLPAYDIDLNDIHAAIQTLIRGPEIIEFRSNESLFQEELDKIIEREQVACYHFTPALYAEALLNTVARGKIDLQSECDELWKKTQITYYPNNSTDFSKAFAGHLNIMLGRVAFILETGGDESDIRFAKSALHVIETTASQNHMFHKPDSVSGF